MIQIQQLKMPVEHEKKEIAHKIRKLLRLKPSQPFDFQIRKQSIDARRGQQPFYVYTVTVDLGLSADKEQKLVEKVHNKNIMLTKEQAYQFPNNGTIRLNRRPVIVGSGPAGLFCAFLLAKYGYQPIIIERGRKVEARKQDVERFQCAVRRRRCRHIFRWKTEYACKRPGRAQPLCAGDVCAKRGGQQHFISE